MPLRSEQRAERRVHPHDVAGVRQRDRELGGDEHERRRPHERREHEGERREERPADDTASSMPYAEPETAKARPVSCSVPSFFGGGCSTSSPPPPSSSNGTASLFTVRRSVTGPSSRPAAAPSAVASVT